MVNRVVVEMFGWLNVLVSAAGAVVSATYVVRSRWAVLLLMGFGTEMTLSLFYRLREVSGLFRSTSWESVYLVVSLLALVGHAAVVIGLAGLLWGQRIGTLSAPEAGGGA